MRLSADAPRLSACGELSVWCQPGRSRTLWLGCGESGRYVSVIIWSFLLQDPWLHQFWTLPCGADVILGKAAICTWIKGLAPRKRAFRREGARWQEQLLKSLRLLGTPWKMNAPPLMVLAVCPCRRCWKEWREGKSQDVPVWSLQWFCDCFYRSGYSRWLKETFTVFVLPFKPSVVWKLFPDERSWRGSRLLDGSALPSSSSCQLGNEADSQEQRSSSSLLLPLFLKTFLSSREIPIISPLEAWAVTSA